MSTSESKHEETRCTTSTLIRIPEHFAKLDQVTELSCYDQLHRGRPIPMIWFYTASINPNTLIKALVQTLVWYPVFCGRYVATDTCNPTQVLHNNTGVPLESIISNQDLSQAIQHIPYQAESRSSIYTRNTHARFVHSNHLTEMDPDVGTGSVPLLSIRITTFATGGTAIGMLLQHSLGDAETQIDFARNWSRTFRGLTLDPAPIHNRGLIYGQHLHAPPLEPSTPPQSLSTSLSQSLSQVQATPTDPGVDDSFKLMLCGLEEKAVPAFAAVMPKIMGAEAVCVPLCAQRIRELKVAASGDIPEGSVKFVSSDDVVVAHVWKALLLIRCDQLHLSKDCKLRTTIARACNLRSRSDPPLGLGYCGNGVTQVWTELSVTDVLTLSVTEVALHLRASLEKNTPSQIQTRAKWIHRAQQSGSKVMNKFDAHALTFIISSWRFDWESVCFEGNSPPICFDHGALVPIVVNFVTRPNGDGLNVYTCGTHQAVRRFTAELTKVDSDSSSPS